MTALGLLLAGAALAQSPMPTYDAPGASTAAPVAASTAAAVAVSSAAVAASTTTATAEPAPPPAPKPVRKHPVKAVIHTRAAHWKPVSLRVGGDPGAARARVVLRGSRVPDKYRGRSSKAKATARLYSRRDEEVLVVSVFPEALAPKRKHFELRFRLVEGYVEEFSVVLVTVVDRRPGLGADEDARELARDGIEYEEAFPASGAARVSALDPRPSARALNAGSLSRAEFSDRAVGTADVSWSAKGVSGPR